MSAETDLLPSSVAAFTEALHGDRGSLDAWLEVNDEREVRAHVEAYARANLTELQREVEGLRAEVAELRTKASEHRDGRLAALERAERLAEALREVGFCGMERGCHPSESRHTDACRKARAALGQETTNG